LIVRLTDRGYYFFFSPPLVFKSIHKPTAATAYAAVWSPTNGNKQQRTAQDKSKSTLQFKSPLVGDQTAAAQKFKKLDKEHFFAIACILHNLRRRLVSNSDELRKRTY
jgi:hypothetical protein